METKKSWSCVMCGIGLNEAVGQEFNVLKMTPDEIVNDLGDERKKQYIWERTQKNPKKTCSKSCGSNYTSWLRTQEPKRSYIREDFKCDCCGKASHGGRLLINHVRNYKVCRSCHRKNIITEGRRMWEIFNKKYRIEYQKAWRLANRDKYLKYKRRYRERVKNNKPRLGTTRKIICAVNPHIFA
jgi:hypothetical protein